MGNPGNTIDKKGKGSIVNAKRMLKEPAMPAVRRQPASCPGQISFWSEMSGKFCVRGWI